MLATDFISVKYSRFARCFADGAASVRPLSILPVM